MSDLDLKVKDTEIQSKDFCKYTFGIKLKILSEWELSVVHTPLLAAWQTMTTMPHQLLMADGLTV